MIFTGGLLLYNLSIYLIHTPFKEWHIALLYILVIPNSTMIVLMLKYDNKKGEKQ